MKVVVDTYPMLVRSAGVKNYLHHWLQALRKIAPAGAIAAFPPISNGVQLDHERSMRGRWATYRDLAALALSNHLNFPLPGGIARGADIFHASSLVRHPPRRPLLTATIHDLTSLTMPELHPAANRVADRHLADNLRRAQRIIAVSEATRQDAIRLLGIVPEKIVTIHSGVAPAFFDVPAGTIAEARARYRLTRPVVLSVGTIEPRKNFHGLVSAWRALSAELRNEYELVVAGPMGWAGAETEKDVRSIRYLGYVPERDIAALTAAAAIFAYPSLYEGFGFPVAQAMAAGVPVVTSNTSALPEIAGDAAVLVDPHSQSELRGALDRLMRDSGLRVQLAERGRKRAERFRWETCAAKSWRFFEEVKAG